MYIQKVHHPSFVRRYHMTLAFQDLHHLLTIHRLFNSQVEGEIQMQVRFLGASQVGMNVSVTSPIEAPLPRLVNGCSVAADLDTRIDMVF